MWRTPALELRAWSFCPRYTINKLCDFGQSLFLILAWITVFLYPTHNSCRETMIKY